jgi:hypothetical protein
MDYTKSSLVIPAQAGIQGPPVSDNDSLDPRFRGGDGQNRGGEGSTGGNRGAGETES